jgi:hypothetical protein
MLKKLIWAYLILLFIEGALRKWVLPQLSAPLLIVRDPVAIWIIWEAYRTQKWPRQWSIATGLLTAVFVPLAVVQMVALSVPWFVVLYGLRAYLLPFPVAFIIGSYLDREDVEQIGRWILLLLIPTVLLEVAQYRAAATSWLNAGAGVGSAQIGYTGEHVRASGTFSYVAGPMLFIPLAAAFIFHGLANPEFIRNKKWLLWTAAAAIVLSIPVTGSRTMIFTLAATLFCVMIASSFGVTQFAGTLKAVAAMLIIGGVVSLLPVFSDANESMTKRFSDANSGEGGAETSFILRTVSPVTNTLANSLDTNDWLGVGMGYGSNVASKLLTGDLVFLVAENEFPRLIGELGPPLGIAFMLFRFCLALVFLVKGLDRAREKDPLPWLLVPVVCATLVMGILEQPTEQGFMVVSVGFSLAALKRQQLPVAKVASAVPRMLNRSNWQPQAIRNR